MPIQILMVVIGLLGLGLAIVGFGRQRRPAISIDERLANFADRPLSLTEQELQLPFAERVLRPILKKWALVLRSKSPTKSTDAVRIKLAQAGNPSGMGPVEFLGLRALLALGLGVGTAALLLVSLANLAMAALIGPVMGVFGFLMPGIWLDRKIKARRKEITKSLPDAIDLLTISVESGLGFDPALMRVAEKWDNALTREFARVLSEMRIGKTKREALREMAERVEEDGLSTFVSAVIQADQLGVAISQVLRIQSEAMRTRRRQ